MSTLPEPRILKFTRWLNETRGLQFDPTTVSMVGDVALTKY